jgi:HD-GYP domain-containing protein (c-di-GMP phosphodiesterase class II)
MDAPMRQHEYQLKTFVHRVLALRLLVAGLIVAVAFGAIAYARGYERIGEAVVLTARNGIERIRIDVRQLLENTNLELRVAIQQVLDTQPDHPPDRRNGQFVIVRFYDPHGAALAEHVVPIGTDAATLTHILETGSKQFPTDDKLWQQRIEIAGHPYIHMVMPVMDRHGALAVYAEGLFRVSEEAVAQVRRTAMQTALYVSLIVLATALLLYPVILTLMRRLAHYSESLLTANLEVLEVLGSAIAKRDSDTDAHNYRVTLYSLRLAEATGLNAERVRALIKGAFLHDVGKIGVRDNILHKPARLDVEEFRIMQTHVDHGLDIVHRSRWLADAEDVVGSHHEKFDGSGYPKQLAGEAIPLEARIFAIADVFDALTSRRPYKEPLSFDETMQILESGRGQHFDPALLDHFAAIARELYDRYCGRDDDGLREEVRTVVGRFFVGGLETLRY